MNKLRAILTWGLLSAAAHVMGYSLTVSPTQIEAGQSTNLIINLDDAPNNITAYQMMVYLPEGVTVQKKANGKYAYTANADRHDGAFTVTVRDAADGSVLIACFSADKDVLTGTSGELIRLPLEVASTVTTSLQGNIKNIEFSDVNNNAYNPADVNFTMTLKGGSTPPDVSGDVTVSVPEIEMSAGSTTNLIVNMQTSLTNVTAYQLMVYLPEGVTVQKKANGKYAYTANADRHDGNFTVTVKDAADGSVLIACFSADKDVLTGASGELIRLPLEVASTVTTSLQGSIKNIEFSDVNNNAYNPADANFAMTLKGGSTSQIITFEDAAVKALCVANWDANGDGELSEDEAAAVTDLGKVFRDNTEITSFNELQYFTGLTRIIYSAFFNCSRLTSVVIPESVTSIGKSAFYNCSGLTSVTIPNSVTSIDIYAFEYCSSLTSITIPNSVTSIGYDAFDGTAWYNNQPDGLVYAGKVAYKYKGTMPEGTEIILKDGTLGIANCAFSDCDGLTSIIIPESVTSISTQAFEFCSGLTSVTIPESVTSIGNSAFYECSGLTSVTIPNSVTSIGNYAFSRCSGLTSVYCYAENVPTTDSSAFNNSPIASATLHVPAGSVEAYKATAPWSTFGTIVAIEDVAENITFEDAAVKALCVANWDTDGDGELSLTEAAAVTDLGEVFKENTEITSFNELQYFTGLTSIGNHAFYGCSGLTSVTIPNSVTSIGNYAFYNCSGLTSVTIPNSVASISDSAFSGCSGLTSVTIPNSVTSIDNSALSGCSGLTSITIPNSVTSIGNYAFYNCSGLTSVTIPNSVTSISESAFRGCCGLTSIVVEPGNSMYDSRNNCNALIETSTNTLLTGCQNTIIPESVTSIGNYAFDGCSGLTSITIPNSVISIGRSAFYGCRGLTSVTIGNGVTNIGDYAFYYCNSLTSVTIGNGVTSIGEYAFYNCSGLTSVTIPNSVTSIGNQAFYDCSGLISITIPESVTSIGNGAFWGCSGLTSVTIPEKVTSIGTSVFSGCSGLTSVTIPESVTSIGTQAFYGCSGLISITIPESVTSIGTQAFYGCSGLISITIPESVTSIGESAFEGCCFQEDMFINNSILTSDDNWGAALFDEETSDGLYIGNNIVVKCRRGATSVTIPDGVTGIRKYAFSGCSHLVSVTIPNSVTSIGEYAFLNCSNLTTITIPESVTSIGKSAFANAYQLKYVKVESKTPIAIEYAFYNTWGMTLMVPIGCRAAYETADYWKDFGVILEGYYAEIADMYYILDYEKKAAEIISSPKGYAGDIIIPSSVAYENSVYNVTTISQRAFRECNNLTSVIIPEGVTSIGNQAFFLCFGLTSVTIPNSVTSISNSAFYGCSSLTSITIPESVTSIGNWAFGACTGLRSINVEAGNAYYDSRYNCNAIIETATNTLLTGCINTTIPDGITIIGDGAFCDLINLITITIPNSVTIIDEEAFVYSGLICAIIPNSVTKIVSEAFQSCEHLTDLVIGTGVKSIGTRAFEYCSSLTNVYCFAAEPPAAGDKYGWGDSYSFDLSHIEDSTTLHVPESSLESYKSTAPWSYFKNIVPLTENDPNPNDNPDAIGGVKGTDDIIEEAYYDLQGHRLTAPQRGINIIRMSDGTTRKVMVK